MTDKGATKEVLAAGRDLLKNTLKRLEARDVAEMLPHEFFVALSVLELGEVTEEARRLLQLEPLRSYADVARFLETTHLSRLHSEILTALHNAHRDGAEGRSCACGDPICIATRKEKKA